jgi:hypothetical protein
LSNSKDTLNATETEALIEIASTSIIPSPPLKGEVLESKPTHEDWEKLNERLESVHKLDKKLKEQKIIISKKPELEYRVDEKLNVIIDSRARERLEKEEVIHRLEEQKGIVWIENMAESFQKDLEKIEVELEALGNEHEAQKTMLKLKILTQPIIEKGIMIIDSLHISTAINWDSLETEITKDIEEDAEYRKLKKQ